MGGFFGLLTFKWLRWHWSDSPDGEDCFKKMVWAGKWTTFVGAYGAGMYTMATFASGELILTNWGVVAATLIRATGPVAMTGPLYAAVTCLTASFRGKNDEINHIAGAMSTSLAWSRMFRWHKALFTGVWLAFFAAIFQNNRMSGDIWAIVPPDRMLQSFPQQRWEPRGKSWNTSQSRFYQPIQDKYYFPSYAEEHSKNIAKPSILILEDRDVPRVLASSRE